MGVGNGRCHADYINVAFQLQDTNATNGGFATAPGSQKASVCVPGVDSSSGDFLEQGKGLRIHPQVDGAQDFLAKGGIFVEKR